VVIKTKLFKKGGKRREKYEKRILVQPNLVNNGKEYY